MDHVHPVMASRTQLNLDSAATKVFYSLRNRQRMQRLAQQAHSEAGAYVSQTPHERDQEALTGENWRSLTPASLNTAAVCLRQRVICQT